MERKIIFTQQDRTVMKGDTMEVPEAVAQEYIRRGVAEYVEEVEEDEKPRGNRRK